MIPERVNWGLGARGLGVAAALGWLLVGVLRVAGVRRLVVEGRSMTPTLLPGDRLLIVRARRLSVGDLVAVPDPRHERRLLVKRITAIDNGSLELRGDNPEASTDSRVFGAVPARLVRGRVVRRYAPSPRRGPVR
jgi:nickel-type superoxide dismutase maturation protease